MGPASPPLHHPVSYPQGGEILGGGDHVPTQVELIDLPENNDVDVVYVIVSNLEEETKA